MIINYEMIGKCSNCDFKGYVLIPQGFEIKHALCPKCGCKKLSKSNWYFGRYIKFKVSCIK